MQNAPTCILKSAISVQDGALHHKQASFVECHLKTTTTVFPYTRNNWRLIVIPAKTQRGMPMPRFYL